jgi:hypothetical protein
MNKRAAPLIVAVAILTTIHRHVVTGLHSIGVRPESFGIAWTIGVSIVMLSFAILEAVAYYHLSRAFQRANTPQTRRNIVILGAFNFLVIALVNAPSLAADAQGLLTADYLRDTYPTFFWMDSILLWSFGQTVISGITVVSTFYAEAVIEDAEKAQPVRAKKPVTTMLPKPVAKPARALQVAAKSYNNDAEIATALVDGDKVSQIARKLQDETGITYSAAYGRVARIQKKIQTGEFNV